MEHAIIGLLIVLVISMILYVQYNANKSVEAFFYEDEQKPKCWLSKCMLKSDPSSIGVASAGCDKLSNWNGNYKLTDSGKIEETKKFINQCSNQQELLEELSKPPNNNDCQDDFTRFVCLQKPSYTKLTCNSDKDTLTRKWCIRKGDIADDNIETQTNNCTSSKIPDGYTCHSKDAFQIDNEKDSIIVPCTNYS